MVTLQKNVMNLKGIKAERSINYKKPSNKTQESGRKKLILWFDC